MNRRRKLRRREHEEDLDPDLPITPMLDMSFQLLAFFVATFNPTLPEGHIDMALPNVDGGGQSMDANDPLKEGEELIFEIASSSDEKAKGQIAGIKYHKVKGVNKDPDTVVSPVGADKDIIDALRRELKGYLAANNNVACKVKLEMADDLYYANCMLLLDEIKRAGFRDVAPALKTNKAK